MGALMLHCDKIEGALANINENTSAGQARGAGRRRSIIEEMPMSQPFISFSASHKNNAPPRADQGPKQAEANRNKG
jgi:hypothetical protein